MKRIMWDAMLIVMAYMIVYVIVGSYTDAAIGAGMVCQ